MTHRASLRRRVIVGVVGATLAATLATGNVASAVGATSGCDLTGAGTSASPYAIGTAANLAEVSDCNDTYAYFKVTQNIALSGTWTPIDSFTGSLDGNSKTISGLNVAGLGTIYQGLIADIYYASIQNLTLSGTVKGGAYTGGLTGYAEYSNIDNVTTSVTVTGDGNYVGGLVGYASYSTINTVTASGAVNADITTAQADSYYGGVAGYTDNTPMANITASGAVNGTRLVSGSDYSRTRYVGGVVGYAEYGGLDRATRSGAVSGKDYVGGITGSNYEFMLSNVTTSSAVTARGASSNSYVGGITGYMDYYGVYNATATGAVSGDRDYIGGAVGYSSDAATVKVTASGAVSVAGDADYVGGLVGEVYDGMITDSTTSGTLSCGNALANYVCKHVGGAVGYLDLGSMANVKSSRSISINSTTAGTSGGSYYIGGSVGYLYRGSITGSSSTGALTLLNAVEAGGLVGETERAIISKSYSTGAMTISNLKDTWEIGAGGLVGAVNDSLLISRSYSTGAVTAAYSGSGTLKYSDGVGGLIGVMWDSSSAVSIRDSFTRSNVTGQTNVAGIVGKYDGGSSVANLRVKNVYLAGTVACTGTSCLKDAIAAKSDTYLKISANGLLHASGTGFTTNSRGTSVATSKTLTQLKSLTTYTAAGYSTTVWGISAATATTKINGGYAYLK